MQRICVFGAKNAPFTNTLDTRQKLHLSGNNFGNYLIGYAIDRQIKNCDFYDFCDSSITIEEINGKYDKAVVASSNFINPAYNLQPWADFLDKLKIPIVSIGIGAQTLDETSDIKLQPGTLRYLKVISERCRTIGARGEFTASTLNKLGIYNVDVIGCPTVFMNLDRNFRVDRPFNVLNKVVINGLPDKISKKYILHLFKLFLDYDIYYLAQTELSLINKNLQGFFETDEIDSALKNILLNKTMFFEHISQWKRFCQNLSFSIGARFHGNMLAMQVGVPSVWLSHDSRTRELLEFIKLPYIAMNKVLDMSLNDIMEVCSYDNFNSNYQYLYNNYVSFLDKNNLQHVLK